MSHTTTTLLVSDHNDPDLSFEHRLREHTRKAEEYIESHITTERPVVSIQYTMNYGGRWTVATYHKSNQIQLQGAELQPLARLFVETFGNIYNIPTLRAMLPAPQADVDNDNGEGNNG